MRNVQRKQWLWVAIGSVVLVLGLGGAKAGQIVTLVRASESFAPPPEAVTSAEVQVARWRATKPAVASLVARQGVTLGAELAGTVREIDFEAGTLVRRGDLLVRLDTSAEQAQLAAARAEASLARVELERTRRLRRGDATSQAALDAAEARAARAEANVASLRVAIAKKTLRAPFDGRISIRQVELGQVLAPGAPIASLHSVSPIHADFWLPQQALAELRAGQQVRLRTDAYPDDAWEGEITTVNPEVDPATRNVRVRATFENPDGRLRPGMFANAEVLSAEERPVVVVPATSIVFAPYGDSVFAVEERTDETGAGVAVVRQKFVRTGERRGDFVSVLSGLEPGERVVSSGAFKLRNGAPVTVDDALAPRAQLDPHPDDE